MPTENPQNPPDCAQGHRAGEKPGTHHPSEVNRDCRATEADARLRRVEAMVWYADRSLARMERNGLVLAVDRERTVGSMAAMVLAVLEEIEEARS